MGILRAVGATTGIATGMIGVSSATAGATSGAASGDCFTLQVPRALRLQDQPAPGTGQLFQSFDRPAASTFGGGGGWWAFTGDLDGSVEIDDVLYAGDRLVLREGDDLPGVPGRGATVETIPPFDGGRPMNAAGEVATVVDLAVDGRTIEAVMREQQVLARAGDPVPDGAGDRYTVFSFVGLLDDGRVGFMARTDGPADRDSVIVLDGVVLHREGGVVPWDPRVTWDGLFDEVTWNGRGDLLFEGNTSGPADQDRVLVFQPEAAAGSTAIVLLREDDVLTTEKGPVRLELVQQAALSEAGDWAARVLLRDVPPELADAVVGPAGIMLQEGDPVAAIAGAAVSHIIAIAVDGRGRIGSVAELGGQRPPGVSHAVFIDRCAVTATGIGATGLPNDTWLAWIGFEDLAARDDGTFVFTAGYGGSVAGDGLFLVDGTQRCPADLDGDGMVGALDVLTVLSGWGPCPGFLCTGDMDLDGTIDIDDLIAVLSGWGPCAG